MTTLTILIPTLNEAENLRALLPAVVTTLERLTPSSEIVVVDGGSTDGTPDVAGAHGARVVAQRLPGYGGAMRHGIEEARGEFILTMDADLSHEPDVIRSLWDSRDAGDLVVASRYVKGGAAHMPLARKVLSRALNAFFSLGLALPVRDLSSGFRLYRAAMLKALPLRGRNFEVLEEILVRAYVEGWRIREVPFTYMPRAQGSSHARVVRFGLDLLRTFFRMQRLRWSARRQPMVSSGPVRVMRVITRLNTGGPALHLMILTERLDPARYESVLVSGREAPSEDNYLQLHGRSVRNLVVIPTLEREVRGVGDLRALLALVRLMRRYRPHIVHTHTAKAGVLGRLAARLTGVPITVHTYHGHVFEGYFSPAKTRLFLAIERWLARSTDRLLTVSDSVRRELLELGIGTPEQLLVVPLGLDLDPFLACETQRGALRAELGIEAGTRLAGIIARLVPIKRHEDLLRAMAAVPAPSCLVVVGDGERRPALEAMARDLGLVRRVRFLGWRHDLSRIYADLDLVVLTSANEGSPVALIEAMAAARAVLSTRVGGVPDLVEDGVTGVLVPPRDPAALAKAMADLLADEAWRHKLGQLARERVAEAYHARRLVGDIDRLYGGLIAAKMGRPA